LIGRMAAETHLWGQRRIQIELARLGFEVSAQDIYASAPQPGPNRDVSRSASMPKDRRKARARLVTPYLPHCWVTSFCTPQRLPLSSWRLSPPLIIAGLNYYGLWWRARSNVLLILRVLAGLKRRRLKARRAVINRLVVLRLLLRSQRLVVKRRAEDPETGPDEHHQGAPRGDYSIIRGTLLWTHDTLTYLSARTGCLAASSMPQVWHIKGNSV
jgi:hypothetical protein